MLSIVLLVPYKPFGPFPHVSFVVESLPSLGRSFFAHFNFFLVSLPICYNVRTHARRPRVWLRSPADPRPYLAQWSVGQRSPQAGVKC